MKLKLLLTILCYILIKVTSAEVTLPAVLSDNMVLRQKSSVTLWGKAPAQSIVEIKTSWNNKNYSVRSEKDGSFKIIVATSKAGGPFNISFLNEGKETHLKNILLGEIWFCSGQSNMEMPLKGYKNQPILNSEKLIEQAGNNKIRIFNTVKSVSFEKKDDVEGQWQVSDSPVAANTSALAWQFAQMLEKELNVPVGIIVSAWGGTPIRAWMSGESLEPFNIDLKKPDTITSKTPTALFYGMIEPLTSFAVSGFLWYQGENDHKDVNGYKQMMPAMVKDWRLNFGEASLPFYFVQIAPWKYESDGIPYAAYFREMQYGLSKSMPYSGIAVTTDAGSDKTIHPADKTVVAERLWRIAMAKKYEKKMPWLGPEFKSLKIKANQAILTFDHGKGLKLTESTTPNFVIAGADQVFHTAMVKVEKGKLVVWSDDVQKPVAVRYAFENYNDGNLFNEEGLPASTFRTDKFNDK